MRKVRLNELNEAVRSFFTGLKRDESVVVEDDNGQLQYGITPYSRTTAEEKQRAWKELEQLQVKVGRAMKEAGVTEDDVMRELLEDD